MSKWYLGHKKKKVKAELAEKWGQEEIVYRDFDRIGLYNDHLVQDNEQHQLTAKSLEDLNINEVFSKIDRCKTKIGQQYLYYLLQNPAKELEELKQRNRFIDLFFNHKELREELEVNLLKLNKSLTYFIPNIIFDWKLKPSGNKYVILILSVLPLIIVPLCLLYGRYFFVLLFLSFIVNLIIHFKHKAKVEFFISPFSQLPKLINHVQSLSGLDPHLLDEEALKACNKLKPLVRYQFLLHSEKPDQNDFSSVGWLLLEYIKVTFLVENNLLDKCIAITNNLRPEIHVLYKFIGNLDSCQSIAAYRTGLDYFCVPDFDDTYTHLDIKDAYHPLLVNCEPNNLKTEAQGLVITGSNMSGKTTFMRTIALNVIMAQTIYTVCATQYKASFFNVFTSIGIQDDILSGRSYYLEEICSIHAFIDQSKNTESRNLFVIDELFKGTNTLERIAGAKGVLEYLVKNKNMVMVATHDLELANLLSPEYSLFHFAEEVAHGGYVFDYKIKAGVLQTKNAIRLLELFGYPSVVINSANQYMKSRMES
ncbi:hypothetical protein OQX61_15090 [Pedobacter sp. PLR]|uniref:MutS-related protein n=1 Tax=Pedobacter sp. PLR TaxID=2994465 RepID=UPI002247919D|nr:hypothetical protein [Pedobacter sp. PLR]MCX2452601.1 hypothetical protein [Pedobacter sp. PLR]